MLAVFQLCESLAIWLGLCYKTTLKHAILLTRENIILQPLHLFSVFQCFQWFRLLFLQTNLTVNDNYTNIYLSDRHLSARNSI